MKHPEYDYSLLNSCGEDIFVSAHAFFRRPHLVSIGNHVAVDYGVYCTTAAEIGDYIHIAPYVTIIGGKKGLLKMDHFTTIAAGSRIISASDEHLGAGFVGPTIPDAFRDKVTQLPVIFERFASIGTNVVIMPGVTLGEGSVVGACAYVTESTEPWTIYTGVPAKPVKMRPREKMIEMAKTLGYGG